VGGGKNTRFSGGWDKRGLQKKKKEKKSPTTKEIDKREIVSVWYTSKTQAEFEKMLKDKKTLKQSLQREVPILPLS